MNNHALYHLKKIDELTKNIDIAAFDHAWLFIKLTLEICYNISDDYTKDVENLNIKLLNFISDIEIKNIANHIRKKRNLYQHGTINEVNTISENDIWNLRNQIKIYIEYINLSLQPKEQIKYEIGLFRNDFNHFDLNFSGNFNEFANKSLSRLDDNNQHIKFEHEYDYSHIISHENNFCFSQNKKQKEEFLYPIGYGDSNKYLIFHYYPIYNSENPIFSVIFNLLIRSNSISSSYYLQSRKFNQYEMEYIFAYELMLLYFACYIGTSENMTFGVPKQHINYAEIACNDILYYSNLLCKMAECEIKKIKVAELDNDEENNDDNRIYIEDVTGKKLLGNICDDANCLDCGPIITSSYINYNINNKNISSYELILKEIFGIESFREGQVSAISSILNNKDNHIIVLPTGYGKSLIYQFLAFIQPKISVVISPTFILIHDQLENLKDMGISRVFHETGTKFNTHKIKYNILSSTNLIYSTPEEIQGEDFFGLLRQLENTSKIGYINIDECHQMSIWGHSFKPEYFTLINQLFSEIPSIQFLLFSATSSLRVKEDLRDQFKGKGLLIIQPCPLERKNIHYSLVDFNDLSEIASDLLLHFEVGYEYNTNFDVSSINRDPSMSIILCNNTKIQTLIYNKLRKSKVIGRYVALFNGEISTYNRFRLTNKRIIITNDTYLSGINILFLKNIIIIGMPPSKEWLYQESGRVGRNGESSNVLIYLHKEETTIVQTLLDTNYSYVSKENNYNKFRCANLDSVFSFLPSIQDINEANIILSDITKYVFVPTDSKYGSVAGRMPISDKSKYDKPLYYLYQIGIIDRWLMYSSINKINFSNNNETELKYRFFINMEIDNGTLYFEEFFKKNIIRHSFNSEIQQKYINLLDDIEEDFKMLICTFAQWISENVFLNKIKLLKGTFDLISNMSSLTDEESEMILCKYFGTDSDGVHKIKSSLSNDAVFQSIVENIDKTKKKVKFKHVLDSFNPLKEVKNHKNEDNEKSATLDSQNDTLPKVHTSKTKMEEQSICKDLIITNESLVSKINTKTTGKETDSDIIIHINSNVLPESVYLSKIEQIVSTDVNCQTVATTSDNEKDYNDGSKTVIENNFLGYESAVAVLDVAKNTAQNKKDSLKQEKQYFLDKCRSCNDCYLEVVTLFVKKSEEFNLFEEYITWSSYFEREDEYKENINLEILIAILELKIGSGKLLKTESLFKRLPVADIYSVLDSVKNIISCDVKKRVDTILKSNKINKYYYSGFFGAIKYFFQRL